MAVTWTTIPDADLTSGKPGKQYIFRALRDNIEAALTGDLGAPQLQPEALADSTAGDIRVEHSLAEVITASTTYVKIKEIQVERRGVYRVVFDFKSGSVINTAYAKIYLDGVAVGTERTDVTGSYVTYSEDISGVSSGSKIQIYAHGTGGSNAYIQNNKINSGIVITSIDLT